MLQKCLKIRWFYREIQDLAMEPQVFATPGSLVLEGMSRDEFQLCLRMWLPIPSLTYTHGETESQTGRRSCCRAH